MKPSRILKIAVLVLPLMLAAWAGTKQASTTNVTKIKRCFIACVSS